MQRLRAVLIEARRRATLIGARRRAVLIGGLLVLGVIVAGLVALTLSNGRSPTTAAATTSPIVAPSPSMVPSPSASANPSPSSSPTATEVPVYEDLSGVPTTPDRAHAYPIAVMLDDSPAGRPQAGLSAASIVWQAPVEGGIARYMALFQAGQAPLIGPVRSARLYFVRWAAEWKALYLHAGGPPPLRAFLAGGQGPVIDANGRTAFRVAWRRAPHNLYTTGARLRRFATDRRLTGEHLAYDPTAPGALQPFRDGAPLEGRGAGGTITVRYTSERVDYVYDRESNTWLRSVDGKPQHDPLGTPNAGGGAAAADGPRIAPTSVVVMLVPIRRSSSINGPALGRLEADSIGSGQAWVFIEGRLIAATWHKRGAAERTRFLDARNAEIVLPRGQLFVQVIASPHALATSVKP